VSRKKLKCCRDEIASLLPFPALVARAWRAHVPGASNPHHTASNEPALSIILSMACRISTLSSTLTCSSSGGLRAASRSRSCQAFLPISSRASCFWARNDSGRRQTLLRLKSSATYRLQQSGVFSTSVRRNAERKDGKDATSQSLSEQNKEVGRIFFRCPAALSHSTFVSKPQYAVTVSLTHVAVESIHGTPSDLK
jgi:hypothetical protein